MSGSAGVVIFVRHSAGCDHRDNETYKSCNCRKHLRWSYDGKQYFEATGTRSWSEAAKKRREKEDSLASGSKPETKSSSAMTLEAAKDAFITFKEGENIGEDAMSKYRRELARLVKFMAAHGKVFPNQVTLKDLGDFRKSWTQMYPSSCTRQKVQERLRVFLRYCHDAGHLERLPKLSPIQSDAAPTIPLTDAEYKTLLDAIPAEFSDRDNCADGVRALVQLMRYSGLAIRDAVTLERSALQFDAEKKIHRIVTSRQKTGTHVSVPIPRDVAEEVLAVTNGNPRYIFWKHGGGKPRSIVTKWEEKMRRLFAKAGMKGGHSHQLRDTFACDLLSKGVPLETVSKALGHTSTKTTEKHYAPWVRARQDHLDSAVTATWQGK